VGKKASNDPEISFYVRSYNLALRQGVKKETIARGDPTDARKNE